MTKLIPISRFTVNGNSMKPTLHPGQDVLSFNWFVKPKVGDLVVVKVDGREMVKRIQKVDDRTIYVVGDNKEESNDSRDFGAINVDQIVGKVVYTTNVISNDSERSQDSNLEIPRSARNDRMVDCPKCGSDVLGIYGRKDAICGNCGFKFICCGE